MKEWLKINKLCFLILLSFNFLFWLNNQAFAEDNLYKLPFRQGEKLVFELRWEFVKAGEATLEVLPIEIFNNQKVYHFLLTAKTTGLVDAFYKVRDKIDSYVDIDFSKTVLYKKRQIEGKTNRDIIVNFDWVNKKAEYINFGKTEANISLIDNAFDPFGILFYARSLILKEGAKFEKLVTDGKKCVIGTAFVVKREKIKIKLGEFDTFLIEPELKHISGVFEKSKNAKIQIWLSADKYKTIIKVKSKVAVGSFIGELSQSPMPKGTGLNREIQE